MEENNHNHNHHSHHGHVHHRPASKSRLGLVIFFNILITLAEFVGGLFSGSLALVSDAWHNLSDVLSLMLGYAGERVSERQGGDHFTFGLKRFEVIIALFNALSLLGIGIFIVYEAVDRFLNPVAVDVSIMIPVALVGLGGNVFSMLVLARNRKDSLNLKAAFLHLLYDTVSSVAVIITGIILYYTGLVWLDLVISILIVVMMAWSSMGIIVESLRILLQGAPENIDFEEVKGSICQVPGVATVHGLHIWSVNSQEVFLSSHVCLDNDKAEPGDTDAIIQEINTMLESNFGITHTTLQLENQLLCSLENGDCCNQQVFKKDH